MSQPADGHSPNYLNSATCLRIHCVVFAFSIPLNFAHIISRTDILAVVVDVEEITQFTFKDSNEPVRCSSAHLRMRFHLTYYQRAKRNMTIVDHTTADIRLTLWGNNAKLWSHEAPTMIFCRGVKVNEYQGRKRASPPLQHLEQRSPAGAEKGAAWLPVLPPSFKSTRTSPASRN